MVRKRPNYAGRPGAYAPSAHVRCQRLNLAPPTRYSCIRVMPARQAISPPWATGRATPDSRLSRHLVEFTGFCRSRRRDSHLASILLSSRAFLSRTGTGMGLAPDRDHGGAMTTTEEVAGLPDMKVSVRQVFG